MGGICLSRQRNVVSLLDLWPERPVHWLLVLNAESREEGKGARKKVCDVRCSRPISARILAVTDAVELMPLYGLAQTEDRLHFLTLKSCGGILLRFSVSPS